MAEAPKKTKNIIIKYVVTLAIYTGLAGAVLGLTYNITEPLRLNNLQAAENQARQEVLTAATKFLPGKNTNLSYWQGLDAQDKTVGYVVKTINRGYSSDISLLLGVDAQLKIVGIKILNQTETPGLGTKITESKFLNQFLNRPATANLAVKKDGGELDTITGATISSRAVAKAAQKAMNELKKSLTEEVK